MAIRLHCMVLALACGCARTSDAPEAKGRTQAPPQPESSPTEPEPAPAVKSGCAEVDVGLDLRALPVGSDPQDIRYYTIGQANAFAELAAEGASVELFVATGGVSTFAARITADTDDAALERCREMIEAFLPTVPGHPSTDEPGGSVITACHTCEAPDPSGQ